MLHTFSLFLNLGEFPFLYLVFLEHSFLIGVFILRTWWVFHLPASFAVCCLFFFLSWKEKKNGITLIRESLPLWLPVPHTNSCLWIQIPNELIWKRHQPASSLWASVVLGWFCIFRLRIFAELPLFLLHQDVKKQQSWSLNLNWAL